MCVCVRVRCVRACVFTSNHIIYLLLYIYLCVFRSHFEVNVLVQRVALTSWRHIIPCFSSPSSILSSLYFYTHIRPALLVATTATTTTTNTTTTNTIITTILLLLLLLYTIIMIIRRVYINK